MSKKTEFALEMRKLRRRHIPILFLMVFVLITAWTYWCIDDLDVSRLNDVSAMVFTNLLLMNTILCPIVMAALASRMCDMEQMGNTYKWLCTMQKPEHIYRGKVMAGSFYILLFTLMQTVLFWIISQPYGAGVVSRLPGYFTTIFLTSLCIFILQLNLALKFTNQLTPIFISIGGTFTGLFSWFLNRWPLRYLIPWGYYASLCNAGYNYDETTRYTTYYWDMYPFLWMAVLTAAIIILYRHGQKHFLETVRETI